MRATDALDMARSALAELNRPTGPKRGRREAPLRGPKGGRYLCRGKRVVPGSSAPKPERRVVARRWGHDYRRTFRTRRAALAYGRAEGLPGLPLLLPIRRHEFD